VALLPPMNSPLDGSARQLSWGPWGREMDRGLERHWRGAGARSSAKPGGTTYMKIYPLRSCSILAVCTARIY